MPNTFLNPAVKDQNLPDPLGAHASIRARGVLAFRPSRSVESLGFPEVTSRQELTFEEMRACGVRDVLICCQDYRCGHLAAINADRWSDDLRLSDIRQLFTCQACGRKRVDVRPDWEPAL
jgi:hypothetical protein